MATIAEQFLDSLTAKGTIYFTISQFCRTLNISYGAALTTLKRLKEQRKIGSPSKGFYIIITPEFRKQGCLPADFFIDSLMRQLKKEYYVSLLSAALYYGAAHQQPQIFQVMTNQQKKPIHCGNIHIEFIKNSKLAETPTKKIKTRTGYMNISTPEGTAMDMMNYIRQCGGINRIATVLQELAELIDGTALTTLANMAKGAFWVNRLGYLLDILGHAELAASLYENFDKKSRIVALVPYAPITGAVRNKKWRIAINSSVETDIDDSN